MIKIVCTCGHLEDNHTAGTVVYMDGKPIQGHGCWSYKDGRPIPSAVEDSFLICSCRNYKQDNLNYLEQMAEQKEV